MNSLVSQAVTATHTVSMSRKSQSNREMRIKTPPGFA
jgi:hypothetical protein